MTIAISLKVNDGIVLASDSVTSLMDYTPDGKLVVQYIYENSNKIFNLLKGHPIGAISWGAGSIGQASISTLAKDFRNQLVTQQIEFKKHNYSMENVANKFKDFIYDKNYVPFIYKETEKTKRTEKPSMGFMIVGYSSGQSLPEEWKIDIDNKGQCNGPYLVRKSNQIGCTWNGEPEAISRLYTGISHGLANVLKECNLDESQVNKIIDNCQKRLTIPFVTPPMPIQDAINLAEFFVDTTIKFKLYEPGPPTVGGPIEIAAITKHEGFKWVKRKHYFSKELNPNEKEEP